MELELSRAGAAFVRAHEGFVPSAYLDPVRVLTIGIGFTWRSEAFRKWWGLNKPGQEFKLGATMTRQEAEGALIFLCRNEYGKAVNAFLGRAVPQHVFDGMLSPVFNLGPGALGWRWAAAAKRGAYAEAASLLSVTGTTASGKKLPGLVKRRADESELIQFGDYTIGPMKADAMADGMLVRGERGPAVAQLLLDLHALGFYAGTFDDVFGYGAEAAVLAFQRANTLTADGYAGPQTLRKIAEKLAGKKPTLVPKPVEVPSKPATKPACKIGVLIAAIIRAILGRRN